MYGVPKNFMGTSNGMPSFGITSGHNFWLRQFNNINIEVPVCFNDYVFTCSCYSIGFTIVYSLSYKIFSSKPHIIYENLLIINPNPIYCWLRLRPNSRQHIVNVNFDPLKYENLCIVILNLSNDRGPWVPTEIVISYELLNVSKFLSFVQYNNYK